jgi:hypothetical protein
MSLFDEQAFADALNGDGEFALSARYLDGAMKLCFDDSALLLRFRDGRLAGMGPAELFDAADVTITGPVASWREFLKPQPRPFFHDMFAALVREDFRWYGDSTTLFAYYGAFRRMFQLMREHATL